MPVMTTIHPSILSPLLQWWTVVSWMTSLTEQSALPRGLCMELQQATHATLGTGWLGMAQGSVEQTGGGVGRSHYAKVDGCHQKRRGCMMDVACTLHAHIPATSLSTASTAVDCDVLGGIDRGYVQYSSTLVGASATYICHRGYMLVGNTTRNCQEDGLWSGLEPQCNSE